MRSLGEIVFECTSCFSLVYICYFILIQVFMCLFCACRAVLLLMLGCVGLSDENTVFLAAKILLFCQK